MIFVYIAYFLIFTIVSFLFVFLSYCFLAKKKYKHSFDGELIPLSPPAPNIPPISSVDQVSALDDYK